MKFILLKYCNMIQATLTRIMKRRIGQKITHLSLVNETIKEIGSFKIKQKLIKENITKLIEKNVIRRNGPLYEYIP